MSSSIPRRAKARDANEPEFIAAALELGAGVIQMDTIDLAIGLDGVTYLVEVKNPKRKGLNEKERARRARQEKLLREWPGGPAGIVESLDDLYDLFGRG
jgi:hypothetical protein